MRWAPCQGAATAAAAAPCRRPAAALASNTASVWCAAGRLEQRQPSTSGRSVPSAMAVGAEGEAAGEAATGEPPAPPQLHMFRLEVITASEVCDCGRGGLALQQFKPVSHHACRKVQACKHIFHLPRPASAARTPTAGCCRSHGWRSAATSRRPAGTWAQRTTSSTPRPLVGAD